MDAAVSDRVRSVMLASGLNQAAFAAALATTPDKLSKSFGGSRKFTVTELSLVAEMANKTLEWVLKGEVEAEWRLAARSLQKDGSALSYAHNAVHRFTDAHEQAHLVAGARPRVLKVLPMTNGRSAVTQGERLADQVAALLGHQGHHIDRIADLASALEQILDVDIARVPIPSGLDGCALSTDTLRLIVIGTTSHAAQQRFTLAHECGHIVARDAQNLIAEEVDGRGSENSEMRANSFAAHLLVPKVDLLFMVDKGVTRDAFDEAVATFRVSPSMMYYRFLNEKLIDADDIEASKWRGETYEACLLRQGLGSRLAGERDESLAVRIPPRLVDLHQQAFWRGHTSARALANLLEIDPSEVIETYRPKAASA